MALLLRSWLRQSHVAVTCTGGSCTLWRPQRKWCCLLTKRGFTEQYFWELWLSDVCWKQTVCRKGLLHFEKLYLETFQDLQWPMRCWSKITVSRDISSDILCVLILEKNKILKKIKWNLFYLYFRLFRN